jgi:uncharacterized protein YbjT (DUF2867 family)
MTAPILLTGGTGTLGRHIVPLLRDAGYAVRVLSRSAHHSDDGIEYRQADLSTGEGVAAAVDGVAAIIHCAGTMTGDDVKAQHLVEAARVVGQPHLVYISVVGADRIPVVSRVDRAMFGYFASKRAAEMVIEESGLPWTTLRATQFHDLVLMTVQGMAKLPLVPVPSGFRFQPVDARDVAARLVELALGEPQGLVDDLAGPATYSMGALLTSYLAATGKHRLTIPVRLPGRAARAYRAGGNLTTAGQRGAGTWEDFLAERLGDADSEQVGITR